MDTKKIFKALFEPDSVAFIGLSHNVSKWGFNIFHHIIKGEFGGRIYPVNPQGGSWYGKTIYKNLEEIKDPIDLAIIVVSKAVVPETVRVCVKKGIAVAIIITAGFSETGSEGARIESEIVSIANKGGMRIVGPNTMGVSSSYPSLLYSMMASLRVKAGEVAIVAQSGNLGGAMAYSFHRRDIGISRLISSGNEADLRVEDYLELLEHDSKTRLIALYVEGIRDSHRFMEIAKRISRTKPILLLKGGTSPIGAQAARSHTGAMAGDDAIFRAMCRQTGIIQVDSTDEMVNISGILLSQPKIGGNKVGIVTLGGGWGVIATDYCASSGLELVQLDKSVIEMLDKILPPYWSRSNPIDLVAPNRVTLITDSINVLLKNTDIDAIFVMGLGFMTIKARRWLDSPVIPRPDIEEPAQRLMSAERDLFSLIVEHIRHYNKPIIPVMGSVVFDEVMNDNPVKFLDKRGIMAYSSPEYAISAFTKAFDYYRRTELL